MIQGIIKKGIVTPEVVGDPKVSDGCILIKLVNSCISTGTEMSGVVNSDKNLIKRALEQPENVKKVLNMARSDGLLKTFTRVRSKLDGGNPTGYSVSGIVIGTGKGVTEFEIGDKVAAAGAGYANHAEFVDVPKNLVMKLPPNISMMDASTVTLGGIALQGIRRADLRLGEYGVVIGCGIIGLLSIQLLKASGIHVIALDLDDHRLQLAKDLGASLTINPQKENSIELVSNYTSGHGADSVIFTAATTSSKPLSEAFQMCRKKGKLVLVGVSGMEINRADIYKKELDFLVSTSYGPGRYDEVYEEKGIDYPYAYVRWTENRNMGEYLRLLSKNEISVSEMISASYPIEKITDAYNYIKDTSPKPLMVLLDYGNQFNTLTNQTKVYSNKNYKCSNNIINVALIGAGSFGVSMHLPNIKKLSSKYRLKAVMSRKGHAAKTIAEQYGAEYSTTSYDDILSDDNVDLVLICTRHDSHAKLTIEALRAGKNVFVEKPLATKHEEVELIKEFYSQDSIDKPLLMVGFNRRFSDYAKEIKNHTSKRINPLFIRYRMNAGYIPLDSWHHDFGGRIVGEACHIIDFVSYLTESSIVELGVQSMEPTNDKFSKSDNKSITIKYSDGSIASIEYFSVGSKKLSKEFCEVHFDGKSIILDDYKSLIGYGLKIKEIQHKSSEKGQFNELGALYESLVRKDDQQWPIDYLDMIQTTEATILINEKDG